MDIMLLGKAFGALLVVLLLIGVLWFLWQRRSTKLPWLQPKTKRRLSMVETLALGPRHYLALVRCDDQDHLIMVHPTHSCAIAKASPPKASV